MIIFNNRNAPQDPKLTGSQTTDAKPFRQEEASAQDRPSAAAIPSNQSSGKALAPCLSASHLNSEANVPPGAAPASPLQVLSRIYRQGHTGIPSHHHSTHQICHRIIVTISNSLIYLPKGQGKRRRHRLQKRFRIKSSKCVEPWPQHWITGSLIRYVGLLRTAATLHRQDLYAHDVHTLFIYHLICRR